MLIQILKIFALCSVSRNLQPILIKHVKMIVSGSPSYTSGKESACQRRRHKRHKFCPWVRKSPLEEKWQPVAVFFPGKFNGQRSVVSYSPWGHKELDTTEHI